MFHFMLLQCVAIVLLMIFPQIATYLPDRMREDFSAEVIPQIDDSQNRLEEDPLKGLEPVQEDDALEKDGLKPGAATGPK
jgi:hypothetical protein